MENQIKRLPSRMEAFFVCPHSSYLKIGLRRMKENEGNAVFVMGLWPTGNEKLCSKKGYELKEKEMKYVKALKCRECGQEYEKTAKYVCEFCFGPLEAAYDYDRIKKDISRVKIASRPLNIWRYRELLPVEGEDYNTLEEGFTP